MSNEVFRVRDFGLESKALNLDEKEINYISVFTALQLNTVFLSIINVIQ